MTHARGVLVDAHGDHLPRAFTRLGITLTHLRSTPSAPLPTPTAFTEFLIDGPATEVDLKERAPLFVLAGHAAGGATADRLSEALGLRTNGTARSEARHDKHRMIDAIRAAGLRTAEQLPTTDAETAIAWADAGGHWPCVVRSDDGVVVCRNPADVRRAFPAALAQSFLDGTEYTVDTVSVDGAAFVAGVWRREKRLLVNGKPIANRDLLVSETDPVVPTLAAYTRAALAALGIRNGPAHTTVIVGPAGPAVVGVEARLNDNLHPELHQRCLGHDQAELTALAYVHPAEFLARYADGCYERRAHATVYTVPTRHDGTVRRVNQSLVDAIRSGPSVVDLTLHRAVGDRIVPTRDLATSPMRVFMTGSEGALEADYRFVEFIRERLFEVLPRRAARPAWASGTRSACR